MKPTIQTYTGKQFDLLDPQPEQICIEDIAHALSNMPRFAGHTREFYSVAQHCLHVSYLVEPEFALAGLLHDAHEAYVLDMPTPLKQLCPHYRSVEDRIKLAVLSRFDLCVVDVNPADLVALATEKRDLMASADWWDVPVEPDPETIGFILKPQTAEKAFLKRYEELTQ